MTSWLRRVSHLLTRQRRERELAREMAAHRAQMGEPQRFGNTLRLREEAREAWGWTWLDDLAQDARHAIRTFARNPGFTLVVVLTLALGIGANTGMFSLVSALLLRPLYDRADEVVEVRSRHTVAPGGFRGFSYPNYRDLQQGTSSSFASLAAFTTGFDGVEDGGRTRRMMTSAVTANYFETLGRPLALGRPFTSEEEPPGGAVRVAIVSHAFWRRLGADPTVIGRLVQINGEPFTVVGVAAEGFTGAGIPGPDLWLPLGARGGGFGARDVHALAVVGRLRAGTTIEAAAPALAAAARGLEEAFPAVNAGYTFETARPSRLLFMPGAGGGILVAGLTGLLMCMPGVVLLVACLNLADLQLARGQLRRCEMAVRSSLGAGRWRLIRQLVTEGLLLALAGGAVGLLASAWATRALLSSVLPAIPVTLSLPEVGPDWRVLVATVGFSVAATFVFGAWPARALTGRAVVSDLKRQSGEGHRRPGGLRLGTALVIGQVALSVLLLASGGLFLMSALSAATAEPGFRLDGGLIAEVDPGLVGYDEAQGRRVQRTLVDRLRGLPGLDAVTITSRLPFEDIGDSRIVVPSGALAGSAGVAAVFSAVGRDYTRTLGLDMLGGRDFSEAELVPGSAEPVAIIDDALAEQLWPRKRALGQLIEFRDPQGAEAGRSMRVVGIVPAVKHSLGNPRPFPHVYVPLGQHYDSAMTLQLRVANRMDERALVDTVARMIRDVDARVPVLRVETWRDHLDTGLAISLFRAGARTFSAFAAIALLLAVVGVYGVKSYVVSLRTREFGIRIATGASPRALLWQVLREGSRTTAVGIGIGVLLALGAGRVLQGFLYGINAVEPVVLVTAPLVLLATSLAASYIPARRAARVDPVAALRSE